MSLFTVLIGFLSLSAAHVIPPYKASHPDLPTNLHSRQAPSLKTGAWIINYKPADPALPTYRGPLRITSEGSETFISGDLYNGTVIPNPADGSPVLPRKNYWAYVRASNLSPTNNGGFELGLEFYRFWGFKTQGYSNVSVWEMTSIPDVVSVPVVYNGGFNVTLSSAKAPTGFPDSANYFEGELRTADGKVDGTFSMGWVSKYVRKIKVEILTATGVPVPLNDSRGVNMWKQAYEDVGFDIDVHVGKTDIPAPNNPGLLPEQWKLHQQEAAVVEHRSSTNYDQEFKYCLLAVKKLEHTARGHVIDQIADFNSDPREGAAVASEWIVGTYADGKEDNSKPGRWPEAVKGKKFYELWDAYYRTALHEVGHMFNIFHPDEFANDIMTDTDSFADAGNESGTGKAFPENITPETFRFIAAHKYHMRHRPDTHVRPAMANIGASVQNEIPPANFGLPTA